MQEGSVSLFFGSYGLLFLFLWFRFPACPFSQVSGLPAFSGLPACLLFRVFRFARFPGFPACLFSLVSGLPAFSGLPACLFFLVSGLPVFSGLPACLLFRVFRFARFPGFPACLFSLVSGLPVFSGFRLARFLGLFGLFSVLYRGFFRFLFCICKVAVLFCPFGRKYTNPVPESQVVDYQIQPFR